MFDVNTAAPTVNHPSDLLARKYCSGEACRRYPTRMPKGRDADQIDRDDDRINVRHVRGSPVLRVDASWTFMTPPAGTPLHRLRRSASGNTRLTSGARSTRPAPPAGRPRRIRCHSGTTRELDFARHNWLAGSGNFRAERANLHNQAARGGQAKRLPQRRRRPEASNITSNPSPASRAASSLNDAAVGRGWRRHSPAPCSSAAKGSLKATVVAP